MTFSVRPVGAALLLAATATLLTACDYASNSPGTNRAFREGFGTPPGYTNAEVNRDSINNKQTVRKAIGLGSAPAIKNGTVTEQLNSAPAGTNGAEPQQSGGAPAAPATTN